MYFVIKYPTISRQMNCKFQSLTAVSAWTTSSMRLLVNFKVFQSNRLSQVKRTA